MSENTFAALLFSIVGVIYIGLGIPLLLERIPPNGFYGCRNIENTVRRGNLVRSQSRNWAGFNYWRKR